MKTSISEIIVKFVSISEIIGETISMSFLKKMFVEKCRTSKQTRTLGYIEMEFKLKHATVSFNLHTFYKEIHVIISLN